MSTARLQRTDQAVWRVHRDDVDAVEELLARQGRVARRRDLLKAGLSRRELRRRVLRGELRPLSPHLFTDAAQPSPGEDLRAAAVALDAVVSHQDAALLWGLELVTTPTERTLTVGRNRSRAHRAGVRVHRADLDEDEQVLREGLRITTVVVTVVDLARRLPLAEAVAVGDSALRRRLATLQQLRTALRALPAGRGRDRVARVIALLDPRCGSVLESLLRVLLTEHGLRPQTQVVVRTRTGRRIGRVDFAWPDLRLVVECDGFACHADRTSYRQDRRRGNALVLAGWQVLRFSWEDVVRHPAYVVATVRGVLAAASRPCSHTA